MRTAEYAFIRKIVNIMICSSQKGELMENPTRSIPVERECLFRANYWRGLTTGSGSVIKAEFKTPRSGQTPSQPGRLCPDDTYFIVQVSTDDIAALSKAGKDIPIQLCIDWPVRLRNALLNLFIGGVVFEITENQIKVLMTAYMFKTRSSSENDPTWPWNSD